MSQVSLRLVHDRPIAGHNDDLAATLLFSIMGLFLQLTALAVGIESLLA